MTSTPKSSYLVAAHSDSQLSTTVRLENSETELNINTGKLGYVEGEKSLIHSFDFSFEKSAFHFSTFKRTK